MASTTAVVYFRPRFTDATAANRQTEAVVYIPFRDVSGVYVGFGLQSDDAAASPKSMLPGPRTPFGYLHGDKNLPVYIDEATWLRLLTFMLEKMGGIAGPSMADVAATVTTVQEAVTSTVTTVTELTDQALQNAAVLDTVREVAQTSDLDGAEQIPTVIRQLKSAY
jgi:hypothetical protein